MIITLLIYLEKGLRVQTINPSKFDAVYSDSPKAIIAHSNENDLNAFHFHNLDLWRHFFLVMPRCCCTILNIQKIMLMKMGGM